VNRPLRVGPRGLPGALPDGERLLWQGSPDWRGLALRAFHIRKVAVYFAALLVWRGWVAYSNGQSGADAVLHAAYMVPVALAGLGILALLAWGYARTSIYTLTSHRVVVRTGIALPMTLNLPFRVIATAGLGRAADGTGDIVLGLNEGESVSRIMLWPHVRPWHWRRQQPMLRAVKDPEAVARILAKGLADHAGVQPEKVTAPAAAGTGKSPDWLAPQPAA
jgi:Bacterial PH domain